MIPKVFHSIWVGPPMPAHLEAYLATWTQVNPGWEQRLWTGRDLRWLANQELFDNAETYTDRAGQFRADIARYEILGLYGGVYVDCDFEARKPIGDLIADVECFAAWETDDLWINNAILGAEPGHPLLAELIRELPANVARHEGKRPNVMTGPQFVTPIARRHRITVFPSAAFYPYLWNELERGDGDFPDAYAVHHWENKRSLQRAR